MSSTTPSTKGIDTQLGEHLHTCSSCREFYKGGGFDYIDLKIYHDNNHVWPGFAGELGPGFFGGSDF